MNSRPHDPGYSGSGVLNPQALVCLDRETWRPIDIGCAAAFLSSLRLTRVPAATPELPIENPE